MLALPILLWPYQAASQKTVSQALSDKGVLSTIQRVLTKQPVTPQAVFLQQIATETPKGQATTAQIAAEKAQEAAEQAAAQQAADEATQQQAVAYTASNSAMMYIFMNESGNNPEAINASSGACGLGQALPCSKLPCSLADYACQVQWFTDYANSRYGGWPQAAYFWSQNHWW